MKAIVISALAITALVGTLLFVGVSDSASFRGQIREGGSGTFRHAVMKSRTDTCRGISPLEDNYCLACLYNCYNNVPGLVFCPGLPNVCTESGKDVTTRNYKLSQCLGCLQGDQKLCSGEVQTKKGMVYKELVELFSDRTTKNAIDTIVYGFGETRN